MAKFQNFPAARIDSENFMKKKIEKCKSYYAFSEARWRKNEYWDMATFVHF